MTKKELIDLKIIIKEAYEAACMECGYEESADESVQSKDMEHRRDAMGLEEEAVEEYLSEEEEWIQKAVEKPGALRATARRKGLVTGDEPLSKTNLKKLEAMGGKTAKRARLARTLKGLKKK